MREKVQLTDVEEIIAGGPAENERVALCRYQGHEGIIDLDGNVIVPFVYSSINGFVWDESGRLAVINDEGLLGHVDMNGNEVIPCQFPFEIPSEPLCFHEGRFPVCDDNGLIGFIDPQGKMVIPCQYYQVRNFHKGLCPVMNEKKKWGYVDRNGTLVIPFGYSDALEFNDKGEAKVIEKICLFFDRMKTITMPPCCI